MKTQIYKVTELKQNELKQINGGSELLRDIARGIGRIFGHIFAANDAESETGVHSHQYE